MELDRITGHVGPEEESALEDGLDDVVISDHSPGRLTLS